MPEPNPQIQASFDALLPKDMALKAEASGVAKARLGAVETLVLAALAGAFIALGAVFSTTAGAGADALPFGVARLISGLTFSLGLVLVVVAGAELFTGNTLIVMAWANGKVRTRALLRNWALVYAGNLLGALLIALLVFLAGQYQLGGGSIGRAALRIAQVKASYGFMQAFWLGVLCNVLVCLAVWLCLSARTTTDKILAIVPPITAFVAAGFEHSIANMYFLPVALLIRNLAPPAFWTSIDALPTDFARVTFVATLQNLVPVTLGNVVGGTLLVGLVYWFVYLRASK